MLLFATITCVYALSPWLHTSLKDDLVKGLWTSGRDCDSLVVVAKKLSAYHVEDHVLHAKMSKLSSLVNRNDRLTCREVEESLSDVDEELYFRESINSLSVFGQATDAIDWLKNDTTYKHLKESIGFAESAVDARLRLNVPSVFAAVTGAAALSSACNLTVCDPVNKAYTCWGRAIGGFPDSFAQYEELSVSKKAEGKMAIRRAHSDMLDELSRVTVPYPAKRSKRDANVTNTEQTFDFCFWNYWRLYAITRIVF